MKTPPFPDVDEVLPEHESGARRMIADASGEPYEAVRTLAEAQALADGAVILEGDYGGQVYVVAPAATIRCSESDLRSLLAEIDAFEWDDPEGARVYFERRAIGTGVAGGMGGGVVRETAWVHPRLENHRGAIVEILSGERASLGEDAGYCNWTLELTPALGRPLRGAPSGVCSSTPVRYVAGGPRMRPLVQSPIVSLVGALATVGCGAETVFVEPEDTYAEFRLSYQGGPERSYRGGSDNVRCALERGHLFTVVLQPADDPSALFSVELAPSDATRFRASGETIAQESGEFGCLDPCVQIRWRTEGESAESYRESDPCHAELREENNGWRGSFRCDGMLAAPPSRSSGEFYCAREDLAIDGPG